MELALAGEGPGESFVRPGLESALREVSIFAGLSPVSGTMRRLSARRCSTLMMWIVRLALRRPYTFVVFALFLFDQMQGILHKLACVGQEERDEVVKEVFNVLV